MAWQNDLPPDLGTWCKPEEVPWEVQPRDLKLFKHKTSQEIKNHFISLHWKKALLDPLGIVEQSNLSAQYGSMLNLNCKAVGKRLETRSFSSPYTLWLFNIAMV